MNIASPMGRGSGAYIVHQLLSQYIPGYLLLDFHPWRTLVPPSLSYIKGLNNDFQAFHTTPELGCFFANPSVPLVLTFHNLVLDNFMQKFSSIAQRIHYRTTLRYFTKKSLAMASTVTTVSHFIAELVRTELQYPGKINVIYNGIDAERFKPAQQKDRRAIKVLFCGNLTKRKGAHWLPEIADKLDKGITILYTSGLRTKNFLPEKNNLRNIGRIPYEEIPAVYQHSDILLFPTVREGFGLAAAEAMACGLPVVATNCSSLPELVENGRGGYLCELGNTDEFARRINELAESKRIRLEMGEFNRCRIEEKFNLQQMIQKYCDLFTEVVETRR